MTPRDRPPPRSPTRTDYLEMGVDPAVLDRIEAEQATPRAAPAAPAPRRPEAARTGEYFVLSMAEHAETAACRFMDEGWDAGIRDDVWPPSFLWVFGWCAFGTAHHNRTVPVVRWTGGRYLKRLDIPCTFVEIYLYGAKPAIDREEAEHRAETFCRAALTRARQLYRDGFYADPFTATPTARPDRRKAH